MIPVDGFRQVVSCEETGLHSAGEGLASISHLLLDMDGVLFRGKAPIPGAIEFIHWLRQRGTPFQLLTNNSTLTPQRNSESLASMGIEVSPEEIFTSSLATAGYLRECGAERQRVFIIGEEGLIKALEAVGMEITQLPNEADWVIAGLDRNATYSKLRDAATAIQRGAKFVATNADSSLPVEHGVVPGAGALQAVITTTTNVNPLVIGKPEARMLELGAKAIGGANRDTAMVGDRLDTDIEAANRAQMRSILVLTGVTNEDDLTNSDIKPDLVVRNLQELKELLARTCLGC